MILFPGSVLLGVPKHSTNLPSSAGSEVPLSVDEKEKLFNPNPVPDLALKALPGPQTEEEFDLCGRGHSLLPPTIQVVSPFMSPTTVHINLKVSPGQVGRAAVNCPATISKKKSSR